MGQRLAGTGAKGGVTEWKGEGGARMAGLEEDADGREKGKSCKARHGKGLQGGFVFGKRTHGGSA